MERIIRGSAALLLMAVIAPAQAQTFSLADRNSAVEFDADEGAIEWTIDGVGQLAQQWFWYRLAGDTSESRISSLPLISSGTTDTNPFTDTRDDSLSMRFGSLTGLNFEVAFHVQGGLAGSGVSDMAEQIAIHNDGASPLTLSFFQYSDFDLAGTPSNDTAFFVTPNAFRQTDPSGTVFSETVVTPMPSAYAVGLFPSLIIALDDGGVTNLANVAGPLTGDLTWAFQWNLALAPGQSVTISKDKNFVPEPATMLLVAMATCLIRRRSA